MAGFKYTPDDRGLAELGRSSQMGAMCLAAAQAGARYADADDRSGSYQTRAEMIPSGRHNELRAGAVVEETEPSYEGARKRTLVRSVSVIEAAG